MIETVIPHQHIDKRLLFRLSIFLLIALVICGIVIRDVYVGDLIWWMALIGVLVGIGLGYILGRVLTVKWHETKQKAVMEMDIVGFIAIGVYIAFRLGENWLLGFWLSGVALSTLSLAVLGGALLGRFLGLRISILKLVEENT